MNNFSRILSEAEAKEEILPDGGVRVEGSVYIRYYDKNFKYHRLDGPAVINKDGGWEGYYTHGVLHRIDGPAVVDKNNKAGEEYWVNGRKLSKEEFDKHFGGG